MISTAQRHRSHVAKHATAFVRGRKGLSPKLPTGRSFSSLVTWEIAKDTDQRVGILTLNAPESYNALTVEMGAEFRALVSELETDLTTNSTPPHEHSEINAVVVRGAGDKAFSAGGNLEWLQSLSDNPVHTNVDAMLSFYKSFLCIREKLPVPTIAALQGPAVGAGACLALACDLRVGASGNLPLLGFSFAKLGIPTGMGGMHLLQNCGRLTGAQAAEILLCGKTLTGEDALDLGLVNKLVPQDAVESEAVALAHEIATNSHPVAVRSLVRSLRLTTDRDLAESLYRDAHAQAVCYHRKDWGRGLEAARTKTDPAFDGYHAP